MTGAFPVNRDGKCSRHIEIHQCYEQKEYKIAFEIFCFFLFGGFSFY